MRNFSKNSVFLSILSLILVSFQLFGASNALTVDRQDVCIDVSLSLSNKGEFGTNSTKSKILQYLKRKTQQIQEKTLILNDWIKTKAKYIPPKLRLIRAKIVQNKKKIIMIGGSVLLVTLAIFATYQAYNFIHSPANSSISCADGTCKLGDEGLPLKTFEEKPLCSASDFRDSGLNQRDEHNLEALTCAARKGVLPKGIIIENETSNPQAGREVAQKFAQAAGLDFVEVSTSQVSEIFTAAKSRDKSQVVYLTDFETYAKVDRTSSQDTSVQNQFLVESGSRFPKNTVLFGTLNKGVPGKVDEAMTRSDRFDLMVTVHDGNPDVSTQAFVQSTLNAQMDKRGVIDGKPIDLGERQTCQYQLPKELVTDSRARQDYQKILCSMDDEGKSRVTLFSGPPGNGKTFKAQKLAEGRGLAFKEIGPRDITEGCKDLDAFLESTKGTQGRVILLDEFDAYSSKFAEIRKHIEERSGQSPTFIFAATNNSDKVQQALSGTDVQEVYVSYPDRSAREGIYSMFLDGKSHDLTKDQVKTVAAMTPGFSVADMKTSVKLAQIHDTAVGDSVVNFSDLVKSCTEVAAKKQVLDY